MKSLHVILLLLIISISMEAQEKETDNFSPSDTTLEIKAIKTTCYLRGYKDDIEILGANNRYNKTVGKSGIGFTLNNHNEHFHMDIKPRLKKTALLSCLILIQLI